MGAIGSRAPILFVIQMTDQSDHPEVVTTELPMGALR